MASETQIIANRANAKRSSGPKTQQGKRASAVNALRHGLSKPLVADEHVQSIQAIAKLIERECAGQWVAQDLAIKILEYERNEDQQRRQLAAMIKPPKSALEGDALIEATRKEMPEFDMLQDHIDEAKFFGAGMTKRELVKVEKLQQKMQKLVLNRNAKLRDRDERELRNSLRYFKRSANQLVKAVRSAARLP